MAEIEIKKKISELPEEQESLEGFYTLGYREDPETGKPTSKKVALGFVEQAASNANAAAENANEKANEAAGAAEQAEAAKDHIEQTEQSVEQAEEMRHIDIVKIATHLYDATCRRLDYAFARAYFEGRAVEPIAGGCSVIVKDGVIGRNYDWLLDGKAAFGIRTAAINGRHAVVGMAGGLSQLTDSFVDSGAYSEAYKILPFYLQDGKNDRDLFAEVNVVPTRHSGRTVPLVEKRDSVCAIMLVRYILDNFDSVDAAVAYIRDYVEVFNAATLEDMGYELHFTLADTTKTVVLEIIDGGIVVIESNKSTNFHLHGVTLNEDGTVYTNADVADGHLPSSQGIENYGSGLERFNILNAAEDVAQAMRAVLYSKTYTELTDVWYSEFVGGNVTIDTPIDNAALLARIAEQRQKWEEQAEGVSITVHSAIYKFGEGGFKVSVHEGEELFFIPLSDHAQAMEDHEASIEATNACIEAKEAIEANEEARQSAEGARAAAEAARESAEQSRSQAETARAAAEAIREQHSQSDHTQATSDHTQAVADHTAAVNAANACNGAKAAIEANEAERQAAEAARGTAEAARVAAETARGTAETARGAAETERQSNEQQRQASETARGTAETARETAEETRSAAETSRSEAEQGRQTAETARETAEQARAAAEILRNNAISGVNDLPLFSPDERYLAGKYVLHESTDGEGHTALYVFRFIQTHEAGAWNVNEVVQTSVFNELTDLVVGDVEKIHINVSSSDGELDVDGLQVSLSIEGGTTTILECDEDGNCEAEVAKNTVYTISVADRTGYQHVASYKTRANSNLKYIYLVYEKEISGETCTVTVRLIQNGGRSEAASSFGGKTVNLILSDGTSRSAVTDASGVATFLNVTKGVEGRTGNPKITGFTTPASYNFVTNFDTIGIDLTYYATTAPGIWMVRDDGEEFDYENWDTSDTCVAIHVATQALAEEGCDYYVRIDDLTNAWFTTAHNKAWASSQVNFPHVPNWNANTPYYNGREATQFMMSDAADLQINTPAAEFAVEERFTLNGNTAQGYLGTRDQWQAIVDNKDMIALMYTLIGKSATWNDKNIWTSSQYSATNAWYWISGSWNRGNDKSLGHAVVPFFAI